MTSIMRMTPSAAGRPTKRPVFIGSSSEARDVLNRLVVAMSPYFEPRPWTATFTPGLTTLDVLTAELGNVHACILIFAKDDTRDFRGDRVEAARDNVVLEYGFFVSQLGAQRVWILEEEGVGLPSDVLGLTTLRFSRESDAALRASIDICVDEMRKAWLVLPPLTPGGHREIEDSDLGFANTLREESSRLTQIIERLHAYAEDNQPRIQGPLTFDLLGGTRAGATPILGDDVPLFRFLEPSRSRHHRGQRSDAEAPQRHRWTGPAPLPARPAAVHGR